MTLLEILMIIISATIFLCSVYYGYRRYQYSQSDDNNIELFITENESLKKKVANLESESHKKDEMIDGLLAQKNSYDVMVKYIEQLETTILLNQQKNETEDEQ